jgi:hypothetical protein
MKSKYSFLLILLLGTAYAQTVLSPMPHQCFNDVLSQGKPLSGGKIYTYQSGTSTQQATFTDSTGLNQNSNPIILDAAGCASIWLTSGQAYSFVAQNSAGVQEWTTDNVSGLATTSFAVNQVVTTVAFSPTPTFTATGQYQLFKMTLTGNVTASSLSMTALSVPSIVTFELSQDVTGAHTFAWPLNTSGAAPVNYAANSVTTQTIFWDGTTAYPVNNKLYLPNPGSFTNTQMNQYVESLINGIPADLYHSVQGFPGYTTEAGTFGVAVPAFASIGEADGIVGMVTSACNSASRTTCNAVAVSGHAEATATGSAVWGQNTTVSNHDGTITGVNLVGNEIDVGITGNQSAGYIHGLDIFLSPAAGSTMPSNVASAALEIGATPPSAPPAQWGQGIYIQGASINPSGNAIFVDPTCPTPTVCASAKITLTGFDGTTPHFASLSASSAGDWIISPDAAAGVQIGTKINKYNGITAVGNGVPSEYAAVDLTAQGADIGSTVLYTVPSPGGLYRASCYIIVTQAASVSSTLPNCLVGWTDKDNSTIQSASMCNGSSGNGLTTYCSGPVIIDAKSGVTINYSTSGYATSGATPMKFAIHIRLEAL